MSEDKEVLAWVMLVNSLNPKQSALLKNWLKLFKEKVMGWFSKGKKI